MQDLHTAIDLHSDDLNKSFDLASTRYHITTTYLDNPRGDETLKIMTLPHSSSRYSIKPPMHPPVRVNAFFINNETFLAIKGQTTQGLSLHS